MQTFPEPAPGPPGPSSVPAPPVGATWVAPESTVDLPRRSSVVVATETTVAASRALPGSPVTRLQPRTVGQLLDAGFEVLRFRFREVTTVALTIALPLYAVPQVIGILVGSNPSLGTDASVFGAPGFSALSSTQGDIASALLWSYVAAAGLALATMLVGVGVTHQVVGWLHGADPSAGETLRFVFRRSGVTIGAFVVLVLIKGILGALTCGFGLLVLVPMFSLAAPVVGAEGLGPLRSVGRTRLLGSRRLGPLMGISILWAILTGLIALAVTSAAGVVASQVVGSEEDYVRVVQAVGVLLTLTLLVVQVSVTALAYVDVRVRTEGLDLQLEAAERFPDAA